MHESCLSARRRNLGTLALAVFACAGLPAAAQQNPLQPNAPQPRPASPEAPPPPPPKAEEMTPDGPSYEVTAFILRYTREHPEQPTIDDLQDLVVRLGVDADGVYVAPRQGVRIVEMPLRDLTMAQRAGRRFSVSAINAVGLRLVQELNRLDIIGVTVSPDPNQIDLQSLMDKRPAAVRTLNLDIWTREVKQVRTLGGGPRWERPTATGIRPSQENRVNHPYHDRIRNNSPLLPADGEHSGDLLKKDALDDYLYRLNRQPGRRVDVAVASGELPGDVILDYLVTENRPWTVYAQVSNTGTERTSEWRQRFGFIHNQLRNKDDTLSIDYITASFDSANAVVASYNTPLRGSDFLRLKLFGTYSDFTASDVGFAGENFEGTSYQLGAELIYNVFQRRMFFIDAFGGAKFQRVEVDNQAVNLQGESDFFIPFAGVRAERNTVRASTNAEVRIETNVAGVADTASQSELNALGRLFVDREWTTLKWDVGQSFYLEPLIHGSAWSDPSSPERKTRLAHEIALSARGQYAFGDRLIPQEESTLGGMYTVRGYPESVVAGDDMVMFSAEYRFHLPRALGIDENQTGTLFGKPFKWRADQRYGRPDWDLVFKGFFDYGKVKNSNRQTFEKNESLSSVGFGVDFVFRRNVSVRLDWGFALEDAGTAKSGDSRLHVAATILF
ncbi:MAG: ShlB/FhaC/HecB family hemolysin secretion/activation protein [Phycisphaeraceae bacterium]|nr:ShlB/FhaC/HecB family hemolysin secretion/activation protein [Phycisphaeraceae bacterium]